MKQSLLKLLVCPECETELELDGAAGEPSHEILEGQLVCRKCSASYPVVRGIPRFVESEAYAESFGVQWNNYAKTQRDSSNGTRIFHDRFRNITGWSPESLKDKTVLDVGCGPGSFVEVVAPHCREVIAVDLSKAVDACFANDGRKKNVHVIQADLFKLPLRKESFDRVYSIGVLQHTPDPANAFESICRYVRKGGQLAVWIYDFRLSYFVSPRFLLRQFVARMTPKQAEKFLNAYTPNALHWRRKVKRWPGIGKFLQKMIFVTDYTDAFPQLSREQLDEWARMDTYDSLATKYEIRLPVRAYRKILRKVGFELRELRKDGRGPALVAEKT